MVVVLVSVRHPPPRWDKIPRFSDFFFEGLFPYPKFELLLFPASPVPRQGWVGQWGLCRQEYWKSICETQDTWSSGLSRTIPSPSCSCTSGSSSVRPWSTHAGLVSCQRRSLGLSSTLHPGSFSPVLWPARHVPDKCGGIIRQVKKLLKTSSRPAKAPARKNTMVWPSLYFFALLRCSQNIFVIVFVFVIVFLLVSSCFLITLIKCLNG